VLYKWLEHHRVDTQSHPGNFGHRLLSADYHRKARKQSKEYGNPFFIGSEGKVKNRKFMLR